MRQERDALGDLQLPDDAYFGISTARLTDTVVISAPEFPSEIPYNIVRVRQAQAMAFGRNGFWNDGVAAAIQKAAARIVAENQLLSGQLKVLPSHGGGARSIILNLDEVLANVALDGMGIPKGQYHNVSALFQMDKGNQPLETYLTAVHITLLQQLFQMSASVDSLLVVLKQKERVFQEQETIAQIHFQKVGISTVGADFACFHESLLRCRQQMDWYRAQLIPCWQGPSEVLLMLRELVEMDLAMCHSPHDFPWNVDLYVGLSALLKASSLVVLHFCSRMRCLIGETREIEMPRIRANPAFNPTGNEFLVPDTVSQLAFLIIGADASIAAAAGLTRDSASAYVPLITAQLTWCGKWLTKSLQLLSQNFVGELTGNTEPGKRLIAATPLQAERLIPVLGYDRAVQVARIAALTEKPVRTVVSKMKLMTEEQLNQWLPLSAASENDNEYRVKKS